MSFTTFEFAGLLGTGLTTTNAPAPTTLTTVSPYDAQPPHTHAVSSAWTAQNRKALFPANTGLLNLPIGLSLIPSGGGSVTYTLTLWKWDGVQWVKAANVPTRSYTGACMDYVENPGRNPWFIQVNAISAGTLTVRFNQMTAIAL
jgi:hypothetical protein